MRRILCVWLPNWPILRLRHRNGSNRPHNALDQRIFRTLKKDAAESMRPLATMDGVRGARRLVAVCPLAAASGLFPGQALTEARAICPELDVVDATPEADHAALVALAAWAERYTPLAVADPPEGLFLDITGCGYLFGDEIGLIADIAACLDRSNLPHRLALAGTPGAAWAFARARSDGVPVIMKPEQELSALRKLPVGLLRLDEPIVAGLKRIGVHNIDDLARMPRLPVIERFGPEPMARLDQALGTTEEAIAWPRMPEPWEVRLALAEPMNTPEALAHLLARLVHALCTRLLAAEKGARRFVATFLRVDGGRPTISIATMQPVHEAGHVLKLLASRLPTIDPGFGIDAAVLSAADTEPLHPLQAAFGKVTAGELATTLDMLANRVGSHCLWRNAMRGSYVPERAIRRLPPDMHLGRWEPNRTGERPIRLFSTPEPLAVVPVVSEEAPALFRWRGVLHHVRAASGPERIAVEWWRRSVAGERPEHDFFRDYYRVEDRAGGRFWIFRAGLTGIPRWFLHGLFG
jgi:protein ImuB